MITARDLAQWQAEGRVVVEKSAHRHTWIASITGSCTILCSAAAAHVWQRMQASVELPVDHSAEECLRNSEYSLSPRLILVFGCAAAYGQGAGVAEDPTSNSRCIMGARVKAAVATDASQGMMSHQQGGRNTLSGGTHRRLCRCGSAGAPDDRYSAAFQAQYILDSLGCAIHVAALIEEARPRSAA